MRVVVCFVSACLLCAAAWSSAHGADSLPLATLLDPHSESGLQEPARPLFDRAGLLTNYFELPGDELPLIDIKAPPCCGTCDWYLRLEALMYFRSGTSAVPGIVLNTAGDVLLSAGDVQNSFAPGGRLTWGFPRVCGSQWEFSYFALAPSLGSRTVTSVDDLRIPDPLGSATQNFRLADQMAATYSSTIQSVELDYITQPLGMTGAWKVIAGVRYLHVDETFNLLALNFNSSAGDYHLETVNNLIGAQAGVRWDGAGPRWDYFLQAKVGGYANFSGQSQRLEDFPAGTFLRNVSGTKSTGAFVADIGVGLTRHMGKRWLLHGGYNVLVLTGVATATNQLTFANTLTAGRALDPRGTILLHGFSAGIEARW
jgi:hypothetical protein